MKMLGKPTRLFVFLILGSAAFVAQARGQAKQDAKQKEPLAVVAGQPIYDDDLLPFVQGQVFQLRQQEYEVKSKALENVVNQKLLEAEAKKKGIPAEKLLEQEVDANVEFSDFQCPYCQLVEPTLKKVLAKYDGQVSLAYRDLPLRDIHPQAQLAAEASRCAGEQGKFWEYHDSLFENQDKLNREGLLQQARKLKLDEKQLDSCLSSGKYKPQVEQERQLGLKAGITGTPGFFINENLLTGNLPQDSFEKFIQAELAALKDKRTAH